MALTDYIDLAFKIDGNPPSRSGANTIVKNTQAIVGLNVQDFGIVPSKTAADNDTAFAALRADILADQTANPGKVYDLFFPPNASGESYAYANPHFTLDIKNVRLFGYNATLSCESATSSSPYIGSSSVWRNTDFATGNQTTSTEIYLLTADALAGDTSIFVSTSDAANISVADEIFLYGFDQQNFGFPPNARFFEWVDVASVNTGTGEIGLEKPLRFEYRTDWRDAESGGSLGKARILRLSRSGFTYDNIHEIHGINFAENANFAGSSQYIAISGRKVLIKQVNASDIFPQDSIHFTVDGCTIRRLYEPDKLVDILVTKNCPNLAEIASGTGINSAYFINNQIIFKDDAASSTCSARSVSLIGNTIAARNLVQGFSGCWAGGQGYITNHFIAGNVFLGTHSAKRAAVTTTGFYEMTVKAAGASNEIKLDDTLSDNLTAQRGLEIGSRIIHRDTGSAGTLTRIYYDGTDIVLEGTWQETVVASDVWLLLPNRYFDGGGNWLKGPNGESLTFGTDPFHVNRRKSIGKKTVTIGPDYLWSLNGGDVSSLTLYPAAFVTECRINVLTASPTASNPRLRMTPNVAGSDLAFTEVELDVAGERVINSSGTSGAAPNDTLLNNFISPDFLYQLNWQVFGVSDVAECIVEFDCIFVD